MSGTASASVRTISIASSTVHLPAPRVLGLHQPAGRIRRILQQLLDPRRHRSRQLLEHRLRALGRDGLHEVGRIVGIQFLDNPAELVGGQRVENLGADGRREPGHDGRGGRRVEEIEDLAPGLGPADHVHQFCDVRGVKRRNHRLDGFRVRRLQHCDDVFEPALVCRQDVRLVCAHEVSSPMKSAEL